MVGKEDGADRGAHLLDGVHRVKALPPMSREWRRIRG
jgi:hypothetical protein